MNYFKMSIISLVYNIMFYYILSFHINNETYFNTKNCDY